METEYSEIREGSTRLLVPKDRKITRKDPVFYNPEMELSRDLSVAAAAFARPDTFCDLLAGSGARGIRTAKEVRAKVLLNDMNPLAQDLIKKNGQLNGVDAEVTGLDGNRLMADRWFMWIDIDPFGSPARFMDSAVRAVGSKGVLALTATDTAALCGTSPRACVRKYDAQPLRTDCFNELGLRILIGHAARSAARHDRGIEPLFSHCTRHYFRAYLRIVRGTGGANASMKQTSYLQYCFDCLGRRYARLDELDRKCSCGGKMRTAGPLWAGPFADRGFCSGMKEEVSSRPMGKARECLRLIDAVSGEQGVHLPYYDVHKLSRKKGISSRQMDEIIKGLEKMGYAAVRTHYSDLGLRTDADLDDLYSVISYDMK